MSIKNTRKKSDDGCELIKSSVARQLLEKMFLTFSTSYIPIVVLHHSTTSTLSPESFYLLHPCSRTSM